MTKRKKDADKYRALFKHINKFTKQVAEEDAKLDEYYGFSTTDN